MNLPLKHRILRSIGHVPGLKGADRVLRAFSHPDHQESFPFDVECFGGRYTGNLNNFVDWTTFYYGGFAIFELNLLAALAAALHAQGKQVDFFDVGANVGAHTLFMSTRADRVFSFEPFPLVRDEMKRKLAHAHAENVTIFPVALGARTEALPYRVPSGANQGTGTLGELLPDNASEHTIQVEVARGDDFFAMHQLPPISLLKMDVEGFETKVLEGLHQTLCRDRPPILMEIQLVPPGSARSGEQTVQDLLYPDHLIFEVGESRNQFVLKPFTATGSDEALVIPRELAGILPGTELH